MAAFVDAEHALDAEYAKKLGVDIDNLLVSQPDNGEQALEIVEVLVRSNSVDVVVVDSVAALVPRAEIEGEMGDAQVGLQARLMSQALRKLTGAVSKSKTCLVFINQLREKIGVMFGSPETTTGGRALKFYSSVRIDIRRIGAIKDGEVVVGGRTRVKIVKNKMAPPFREAEVDMMYGEGVSREGDLIDLAVERKIIDKSGAWFSFGGERLGQGRENVKMFLKEHVDLRQAIEDKVRRELGPGPRDRSRRSSSGGRGRRALHGHQRRARPGARRRSCSRRRWLGVGAARLVRAGGRRPCAGRAHRAAAFRAVPGCWRHPRRERSGRQAAGRPAAAVQRQPWSTARVIQAAGADHARRSRRATPPPPWPGRWPLARCGRRPAGRWPAGRADRLLAHLRRRALPHRRPRRRAARRGVRLAGAGRPASVDVVAAERAAAGRALRAVAEPSPGRPVAGRPWIRRIRRFPCVMIRILCPDAGAQPWPGSSVGRACD